MSASEQDQQIHEARKALRLCLASAGLEGAPWFWYAEATLYDHQGDWWPLLGVKYRRATDGLPAAKWPVENGAPYFDVLTHEDLPPFYDPLLATVAIERRHSLTRELDRLMGLNRRIRSFAWLLSAHPAFDDKPIRRVLPWCEISVRTPEQRQAYAERLIDEPFEVSPGKKGAIYPSSACLVTLPIRARQRSLHTKLLATVILFLELSGLDDGDRAFGEGVRLIDVGTALLRFSIQAGLVLDRDYHHVIEGHVSGSNPVALLAHPSVLNEAHRKLLSLEDSGHDHLEDYTLTDLPHERSGTSVGNSTTSLVIGMSAASEQLTRERDKRTLDGRRFSRTLARTTDAYRRLTAPPLDGSSLTGDALLVNLPHLLAKSIDASMYISHRATARSSCHRWLKSLYAHRPHRSHLRVEQSPKYDLGFEHLEWLSALLSLAWAQPSSATSAPSGPPPRRDWACQIWPSPEEASPKQIYEHTISGSYELKNSSGFRWPLEPGIRVLIPWLHTVQWIRAKCESQSSEGIGQYSLLILRPEPHPAPSEAPPEFHDWIRDNINTSEARAKRCGLLLATPSYDEVKKAVVAWRRILSQPRQRRGNDTGSFSDLINLDLRPALSTLGLPIEGESSLFAPLQESASLDLDLDILEGGRLLVALSWTL